MLLIPCSPWCPEEITVSVTTGPAIWPKRRPPGSSGSCNTSRAVWSRMSVRGGLGIWERWWEGGGGAVVTVVRNVGTTVSPIVVLPRVVLVVIVGSVVIVDSTTDFRIDEE